MHLAVPAFVLLIGLALGSFLNVCISRLPQGLSIVRPRSRCPGCLAPISFYDNIPVLSFILLRGRCRHCSAGISWRYPAVELFTGAAALALFLKWGGQPLWAAAALAASCLLIAAAVMDLETMTISDVFSVGLAAVGLLSSPVNPYFSGAVWERLLSSVGGAVFGAFIVWVMSLLGRKIYGKEAVGEGDILLLAGIGALTGWEGAVSALIMASFFGSLYGLVLMAAKRVKRLDPVPFGPFLSLGALINLYSLVTVRDFFISVP
ncbi:MAG TPA: prepilin peptidase [Elusimicrobiales bacterium]|nr:prepilin peptidase [Elusimicrobiales bacterium]